MAAGQPSKLVVFFMENHTADNICSDVAGFDGDTSLAQAADAHPDQAHDRQTWLHRAGKAVRERYTRDQLPLLHSLMDEYAVCDRYFSDVGANSFPNHAFAIGADAGGSTSNPHRGTAPFLTAPGVMVGLDRAAKTWANYGHGFAFQYYTDPAMHRNVRAYADLATDAAKGALPDVSYVFGPAGRDFHPGPGSSMSASEQWLHEQVLAVSRGKTAGGGPLWNDVMMLITFDDWGGWADHVDPRCSSPTPTAPTGWALGCRWSWSGPMRSRATSRTCRRRTPASSPTRSGCTACPRPTRAPRRRRRRR